jgi:hypothetical protein
MAIGRHLPLDLEWTISHDTKYGRTFRVTEKTFASSSKEHWVCMPEEMYWPAFILWSDELPKDIRTSELCQFRQANTKG